MEIIHLFFRKFRGCPYYLVLDTNHPWVPEDMERQRTMYGWSDVNMELGKRWTIHSIRSCASLSLNNRRYYTIPDMEKYITKDYVILCLSDDYEIAKATVEQAFMEGLKQIRNGKPDN